MWIPFAAQLSLLVSQRVLEDSSRDEGSASVSLAPRHAHVASYNQSQPLLFHSNPNTFSINSDPLVLKTRKVKIRRARNRAPHMLSWARSVKDAREGRVNASGWIAPNINTAALPFGAYAADGDGGDGDWDDVEVDAPDVTDRQTLLTLAKMSSNAYTTPDESNWWPLSKWNNGTGYGWEPDADGLRGHIFANADNSTVVIAIKGTSAGVLGSGGPTAKNDKFNDNLMFSCCCARVDFSWSTVCDCYAGSYKCEQQCVENALVEESVYASVGTNLYNNVTYMYPNANIWLTGHSLGGSLSALIGSAFGAPAVGFEAPGDRLPARRLHLPGPPAIPPELSGVTHVYHTADPIPMGACTGAYSGCYAAGFALESKCHTGETILYDTVTVKGWSVDVRTHRISEVINRVLADPWPVGDDDGDGDKKPKEPPKPGPGDGDDDDDDDDDDIPGWPWSNWWGWGNKPRQKKPKWNPHGGVPKAKPEEDCVDCYKWQANRRWERADRIREFGDHWDEK